MNEYTIYCIEKQTKKALKLGAPIREVFYDVQSPEIAKQYNLLIIDSKLYCVPTAEQMINWLEEQGVFISIVPDTDENTCANYVETKELSLSNVVCSSRQEATLAAIDDALEYLMTEKGE